MSVFDELESQYNEIDNWFESSEFEAHKRGFVTEESRYQQKRKINDQAYFLFMFTRLEDHIKRESKKLRERNQKTLGDISPNQPQKKMYFRDHLALLTEKNESDYELVCDYYDERNSLAHGGNFTKPIAVPDVVLELKRLYEVLKDEHNDNPVD
ncbi:MAG: hypothetical protein ACLPVO_19700 [Desulfomonilaceae bacterium]